MGTGVRPDGRGSARTYGASATTRTLFAATAVATLAAAAPALGAGPTVAYIDDGNLWFASADGGQKRQVTTSGTADPPFQAPSQGPDGTTVVVKREAFATARALARSSTDTPRTGG